MTTRGPFKKEPTTNTVGSVSACTLLNVFDIAKCYTSDLVEIVMNNHRTLFIQFVIKGFSLTR